MLKFGSGNHEAFVILLERHEKPVFRFVLRFVSNRTLAEDLTQEVFLKVCKAADRYSKKAKFTTWLYTIARNLCIDTLRRSGKRTELSLDTPIGSDDGDGRTFLDALPDASGDMASSQIMRKEFRDTLEKALAALPDEQREVFVLRQMSGLKFREIADVVGVSENTIKSRMRYALETLRGHLADYKGFSFDADESADAHHAS